MLVVEDDPGVREAIVEALSEVECHVAEAADGEEGLQRLRDHHPVSLVITDYQMPRRNGVQMLQQAHAEGLLHRAHTLLVTALHHAPGSEGMKILHKPLDLDVLLHAVNQLLSSANSTEGETA